MNQAKNIEVTRIYEPDMQAMVRALRVVLELDKPQREEKREEERRYA